MTDVRRAINSDSDVGDLSAMQAAGGDALTPIQEAPLVDREQAWAEFNAIVAQVLADALARGWVPPAQRDAST